MLILNISCRDLNLIRMMKNAEILQCQGSWETHLLINHRDQFESSSVDLGSLHRVLPLPRTDLFGVLLRKFYSFIIWMYEIFLIEILFPRHWLAGRLLDDALCFLTPGGSEFCPLIFYT